MGVDELVGNQLEESAIEIHACMIVASSIQRKRYRNSPRVHCNAHMSSGDLRKYCSPPPNAKPLLGTAMESLSLSARAYDRILKGGRTIADLDGSHGIEERHLAEAIHYYHSLDRKEVR